MLEKLKSWSGKWILQYEALFIISWSLVIVQDYKLPVSLVAFKYM